MSNNNVLKAKISNKLSTPVLISIIIYALIIISIIILGFYSHDEYSYRGYYLMITYWFDIELITKYEGGIYGNGAIYGNAGGIILFIFILLIFTGLPLCYLLFSIRKRKLTELSVSGTEVTGSYTAFIPITKITLRMPIGKVDNVSATNNFFSLFTGKIIRISSASGVIKIPYVANADEIVEYILNAIEKEKKDQKNISVTQNNEPRQDDYVSSIKRLSELKEAGIITEEDFNQKKNELLDKI